ncbi:MAG TPA: FHA domain-containing protein [Steroidobacteraceae bacterium]
MSKDPSNQGTGAGPVDPEQEDTVKLPALEHLELPESADSDDAPTATSTGIGTTVSAAVVQDALEQLGSLNNQVAGLRAVVHERDERLQQLERDLAGRDELIGELRARTHNQELKLKELAATRSTPPPPPAAAPAAPLPAADERLDGQLQQLRTRVERYREALQHADGYRFIFESMLHEHELKAQQAWARVATLERQLVGRVQAAEADTATLRLTRDRVRELEELVNKAAAASPAPAAAEPLPVHAHERIVELESELRAWEQAIRGLQEERAATEQHEQQLQREAAEREAQLSAARTTEQELRLQLARANELLAEQKPRGEQRAVAAPAPDAPARLLVRTTGKTGIVHILAHRTTVGRSPDNSLQLDADFISRHHAVLLETADGTVLEDLNSTNGVYVNGEQISRRRLKPGDRVTIGRTEFRFVIKPPSGPKD